VAHATDPDRSTAIGREWYWLPTAGIATSTLDVEAVARALGRGSTRTRDTVTRLRAKLVPTRLADLTGQRARRPPRRGHPAPGQLATAGAARAAAVPNVVGGRANDPAAVAAHGVDSKNRQQ
jgi:hypothetical protein